MAADDVKMLTLNQLAKRADVTFGFARRVLLRLRDMDLLHLQRRAYRYTIRLTPLLESLLQDLAEDS